MTHATVNCMMMRQPILVGSEQLQLVQFRHQEIPHDSYLLCKFSERQQRALNSLAHTDGIPAAPPEHP